MSGYDYDLFVIGAGSGGVRAARIAAELGARVAIAEEDQVGGTCVLRGCVPKKLFVHGSHFAEAVEDSVGFGWTVGGPPLRLADASRQRPGRCRLAQRHLYPQPREVRRRADPEPRRHRGPAPHPAARRRPHGDRPVHPGRDRRLADARPARSPASSTPSPRTRCSVSSACRSGCSSSAAATSRSSSPACSTRFGVETTVLYRGDEILRGFDGDIRRTVHAGMEKRGVSIDQRRHDRRRSRKTATGFVGVTRERAPDRGRHDPVRHRPRRRTAAASGWRRLGVALWRAERNRRSTISPGPMSTTSMPSAT